MPENDKPKNVKLNVHDSIQIQEAGEVNLEIKKVIKRTADVLEKTNEILIESSKSQSRQQIRSTFIGSVLGFFLAVCLFFGTDYYTERNKKETLKRTLIQECKYNSLQINKTIEDLTKLFNGGIPLTQVPPTYSIPGYGRLSPHTW